MELEIQKAKVCEINMPLFTLTGKFEFLESIDAQYVPVYSDETCKTQIGFASADFSPDPTETRVIAGGIIDYHTPERLDIEVIGKYTNFYMTGEFAPAKRITKVKIHSIWLESSPLTEDDLPVTLKTS